MNSDTTMSARPLFTNARRITLAACFAAVLLGAAAGTARASDDGRRESGAEVSSGGIRITVRDRAARPRTLPFRGGVRHRAPTWGHHAAHGQRAGCAPLRDRHDRHFTADFERGFAAGRALGGRLGRQDGSAGRAACLDVAGGHLPRFRCSASYLDGFRRGYRMGYDQGYDDGRRARRHHCR